MGTARAPLPEADEEKAAASENSGEADLTDVWPGFAKLVAAEAARFAGTGVAQDELLRAGHLGLHAAIARLGADRNDTRMIAVARRSIRSYIENLIRRETKWPGPATKAVSQLARSASRLWDDARKACDHEGVAPTKAELRERVGRRLGLDASVLQLLPVPPRGNRTPRSRVRALADEVLGERERIVFMARSMGEGDEIPSLETLAGDLGVTVERVHEIEISAKRKIEAALAMARADAGMANLKP